MSRYRLTAYCAVGVLSLAVIVGSLASVSCGSSTGLLWQKQELGTLAERGKLALEKQDFETAIELFNEGLRLGATEQEWEVRFNFYLGLTYQRKGDAARSENDSARFYEQAVEYYVIVQNLQPESAPTMNNLAQVYQALGRTGEAEKLYQRAISTDSVHQSVYQMNYADLLKQKGDWEKAAPLLREVTKENPQYTGPSKSLLEYYLQGDAETLLDYLWEALESDRIQLAQSGAFEVLSERECTSKEQEELLTILVICLARQSYNLAEFLEQRNEMPGKAIQRLSAHRDRNIAEASKEILDLHRADDLSPRRFRWWSQRGTFIEKPSRGVWPNVGFRQLARSLGMSYQKKRDSETAEAYYELALSLDPQEPDPTALRQLVNMYVGEGELGKVERLARTYERKLYRVKGDAYAANTNEMKYQYHRSLGELYAYLGRWGDESTVTSAIFQLDHARRVSENMPETTEEERFPPELTDLLAKGYETVGREDQGIQLRLEEAERYQLKGDDEAVRKVLEPIDVTTLSQRDRNRWDQIYRVPPPR